MFIGFYNYTVVLTYIGLCSAVLGMYQAAVNGDLRSAVLCLLVCGLCDMFDGTIARTCKKRSNEAKIFGGQIDSLCDVVCFGVLPAVIGFSIAPRDFVTYICGAFFVLAAVIRLAYFNVQEITKDENEGKREYYLGMPVTSAALLMPAVALVTALKNVTWVYLYPVCLAVLGVLFIARFKVKKPYMIGLIVLAAIGAVVFYLVIRYGSNITCMQSVREITNV